VSAIKLIRREALAGAGVLGVAAALGVATTGSPFGGGRQTVTFWHLSAAATARASRRSSTRSTPSTPTATCGS
jgi:ABC-type glycerol-3-phosphate transport system substrate-binding protein